MLYCTLAVVHALSCRVILGGSDVDQSTVVPPTVPSYAATIITTSTSLFRSVCARRALLARVVGILVIPVWSRYATSLLTRGFPGRVHLRLNNLFTCRVALTRIVSRVLAARIALPAVAYIALLGAYRVVPIFISVSVVSLYWRHRSCIRSAGGR